MWRDRTNLYISYRQSYSHHPTKNASFSGAAGNGYLRPGAAEADERRGLMSPGAFDSPGETVIEMDLLPPRWIDIQDEITERLRTIAQKSVELERLHQKHVLPGFDDEHIKKEEEAAIERITQEITRGFRECQNAIQRIAAMVKEAKQMGNLGKGEETMAQNLQVSLASRVQEVSAGFRKKQSTYLKKLRALEGMTSPLDRSFPTAQNPYTDPSFAESETDKSFSQTTMQQFAQKRLSSNDTAIAQREREINEIAQGIIELADIFKDLQSMVIDQGTMLDRIDYNVERMTVDVKGAEEELTVATGYQKKTTKRKIILLLILVIIGLIIFISIKPRHSGG